MTCLAERAVVLRTMMSPKATLEATSIDAIGSRENADANHATRFAIGTATIVTVAGVSN
jgi:hypothetical protein